ncbi:MAG: class I SAM-dependent methyltransferase [Desulfuromonadales bacterium]|jgi:ubiquinone/menaquinone biosynthesis C-methylase UbiE
MSERPIAAGKSSFDLVDSQKVFAELLLEEKTSFLDLACGTGMYALGAAGLIGEGGRVYAIDLWEEGIDALKQEVARLGLKNLSPLLGDVSRRIPLDERSIDVCLMATVLHDLIEDGAAVETMVEVVRVLKPGGRLAVVEFRKVEGPPGPPASVRLTPEDTEEFLRPFGFRKTGLSDVGPYNYLMTFALE